MFSVTATKNHDDVHRSNSTNSSKLLRKFEDRTLWETLDWFGRVCLQWRDGLARRTGTEEPNIASWHQDFLLNSWMTWSYQKMSRWCKGLCGWSILWRHLASAHMPPSPIWQVINFSHHCTHCKSLLTWSTCLFDHSLPVTGCHQRWLTSHHAPNALKIKEHFYTIS